LTALPVSTVLRKLISIATISGCGDRIRYKFSRRRLLQLLLLLLLLLLQVGGGMVNGSSYWRV